MVCALISLCFKAFSLVVKNNYIVAVSVPLILAYDVSYSIICNKQ